MALTILGLFLLGAMATVMGRLVAGALRAPWLSSRLSDAFPLHAALGTAVLGCLCATASHLGFGQRFVPVAAVALAVALLLWNRKSRTRGPSSRPGRQHVPALLVLLVAVTLALLPVVWLGSFSPFSDAFYYNAVSDWLVAHGVHQLAPCRPFSPALAIVSQFQESGVRLGTSYLQAFLAALTNTRHSLFLFHAVSAWGFVLLAGCAFSLGRRAFGLSAWLSAAATCVVLCVPAGEIHALEAGFQAQLYGLAALMAVLAAMASMVVARNRTPGGALALGLLLAWLVSAYSEFLPFALGALGAWLAWTRRAVVDDRSSLRWHRFVSALAACTVLGANLELARAALAIPMQARAVVGWHVELVEASWAGLFTGFSRYPALLGEGATFSPMLLFGAPAIVLALAAFGLARPPRAARLLGVRIVVSLLGLLTLYFAFIATDPWTGERLQTWSLFKLSGWLHPFLILAAFAGLAVALRTRAAQRVAAVVAALMVLAGLPVQARYAGMMSHRFLSQFAGSERPLDDLTELGHAMERLSGRHVYITTRPTLGNPLYVELLAFFTAECRVSGLWTGCSYIYMPAVTWMAPDVTDHYRPGHPTTLLAHRPSFSLPGGFEIGCGVQAVELGDEPVLCQVAGECEVESAETDSACAWIGSGPATFVVFAPRGGVLRFDFTGQVPPNVASASLRLELVNSGLADSSAQASLSSASTAPAQLRIRVSPGINELQLRCVPEDEGSVASGHAVRLLGVSAPRLRFEP